MANAGLPEVGQTVELWFAGYDQYYPGKVTSLDPPDTFQVLLDDGTSWPVNSTNNVWRYGKDQDEATDGRDEGTGANDDIAEPQQELNNAENAADADNFEDDDVSAPLAKQASRTAVADAEEPRQAEIEKKAPPAVDEEEVPEMREAETDARDGAQERQDLGPAQAEEDADGDMADASEKTAKESQQSGDEPHESGAPQPTGGVAPARRKSGRAFRKSTVAPRDVNPTPDPIAETANGGGEPTSSTPIRRRSARAEAILADEAARAAGRGKPVVTSVPARKPTPATRSRLRRVVSESVPETPESVRPVRRTRQSSGAGQKRLLTDVRDEPGDDEEPESEKARPSPLPKRRRKASAGIVAPIEKGVVTRSAATGNGSLLSPERITRSAATRAAFDFEPSMGGSASQQRDDDGVEKLSTKAVTAIAVDAALASVKAVLKPLNDRILNLRHELEAISAATKKAALQLAEEPKTRRRGRLASSSSPLSAAALESFHLDLSELIGGGEARIKAYSNLSEQEFDELHSAIENQENALKQLGRLLHAAQALSEKAKASGKTATGKETRSGRRTRSG